MKNPLQFVYRILFGFVMAAGMLAFDAISKPIEFLSVWLAFALIHVIYDKLTDKSSVFTTIENWLQARIMVGIVVGIMLYIIGGLRTTNSIICQTSIYLFFCWITYPKKIVK